MAVSGDQQVGCDGCGRNIPLDEITAVSLPDGDAIACCPTCEPHIRSVATKLETVDDRQLTCDGCTRALDPSEATDVTLADGATVTCCQQCLEEVPGDQEDDASDSAETVHDPCTQCHEPVDGERTHVTTVDGRIERLCDSCTADARERGIVRSIAMSRAKAREVLGVPPNPAPETVRDAFLDQIKRAHPDRPTGSESAFKLVKDAYDRLN